MTSYTTSKAVQDIGERLVERHHKHLKKAQIVYVMKEGEVGKKITETTRGKRRTIVKGRKQSQLNQFLNGYDFVIEVDQKHWDELSLGAQEASIDQTLCHMKHDSETGYYMADTPIQTFPEILERHGLWQPELKELQAHMAQLALFPPPEESEPTEAVVN